MIDPAFVLLRKKQKLYGDMFPLTRRQAAMLIDAGYVTEMPGPKGLRKTRIWVLVTPAGMRLSQPVYRQKAR